MYNMKINKLINNIIQKTNKQHLTCNINIKRKEELFFLNYMWCNKIIYGYTLKYNKNYMIHLKYRMINNNIKFNKINVTSTYKSLRKYKLWSKNNFYIIQTIKGFKNITKTLFFKIGGYVLYSIS